MQVHHATRVLASTRRGSSWPLLLDTDGGPFLTKLRGAGHGAAALVAEVLVAGLAEALGLRVPRRALVAIDGAIASENRDPELLHLLDASLGLNLGFERLEGVRDVRPEDLPRINADDAATIAWLDALVMNPDRGGRNPNLLLRGRELWLVDHGSALYFHHDWSKVTEDSPRRVVSGGPVHALAGVARDVAGWDAVLAEALNRDVLRAAVADVPDDFIAPLLRGAATPIALHRRREAYVAFLWKRLKAPRAFAAALGVGAAAP